MTKLTISSAIPLSMSAFKNILTFNPKEYNYHIPNIHTHLNHLFFLLPPAHTLFTQNKFCSTLSHPTPASAILSLGQIVSETRLMILNMEKSSIPKTSLIKCLLNSKIFVTLTYDFKVLFRPSPRVSWPLWLRIIRSSNLLLIYQPQTTLKTMQTPYPNFNIIPHKCLLKTSRQKTI